MHTHSFFTRFTRRLAYVPWLLAASLVLGWIPSAADSTSIVLSATPATISEGSGTTTVTVTATLDGSALASDATVRLGIDYGASTAIRDLDYDIVLRLLTIPAGSVSGSVGVSVTPLADDQEEDDEIIRITGTISGLRGEVDITIIDDETSNPDRAALVALYEAMNGANWTNNTHWLSDRPLDEWHGVRTDDDGRVTSLDLRRNNLIGTIPSELGDLTNLRELALGFNQLSGSLPTELGNLTNLRFLDLRSNQLSGSMPTELGNLTNLQDLALRSNQLSGSLPTELGNLTNLRFLDLRNTQVCAPTDAAFQTWLEDIDTKRGVVNCEPQTEHADLVLVVGEAIEPLVFLEVEGGIPPITHSMSGLPPGLAFDPATRTLSGTPTTAGTYEVTYTATDGSGASASFPIAIVVNPGDPMRAVLVALYEAMNGANWTNNTHWLSDRPLDEWHGVRTDDDERVTSLDLRRNNLIGTIPSELGDLTNLRELALGFNQLSGSLPTELGNLTNLRFLDLRSNQLSGSIPTELGNLTNLRTLALHSTQLSGSIPTELGNLTKLEYLDLRNTQLCAPTDAAFQTWLEGIDTKRGVVNCQPQTDAASIAAQTLPTAFALTDNFPNPFNPTTTIQYALPQATDVELTIYNIVGQPVRTLVAEYQSAGHYAVEWDATNDSGHRLSSGMYFYRLQKGEAFHAVKQMLLLK